MAAKVAGILLASLAVTLAPWSVGQTSGKPTQSKSTPDSSVFKSSSRLVLVDAVVTDSNGQPVHGLRSGDFTVLEDGKPQKVVSFEEERSDSDKKAPAPALNLPPNVYTNYVTRGDPGALTVLLFDSLNTDRQTLTFAKTEMVNFLKKLPPGKKVALYTLGSQLRMVQGFTDNSDTLIAAAKQLSNKTHPVYTNSRELSEQIGMLKESGVMSSPKMYRSLLEFMGEDYDTKLEVRSQDTLDALTQLARSLAVVPGRKNLIWISAGFPFDITSNAPRLQKTAALLAETRIAVYPVDVRGVMTMAADGATRDSEISMFQAYETSSGQYDENLSLVETFLNTAKLTGGRAYINRNDVEGAINDAMDAGANYYSLAYRPQDIDWNGKFRKITVKAGRQNAKVLSRSGYYAVTDPLNSQEDPNREVSLAMQPDVPTSTQMIMKTRVVPPQAAGQGVAIDVLIDMHDLAFNVVGNNQKQPEVQFVAIAWDAKGHQSGSFNESFRTPLSPEQLQTLLRTGLQIHREMPLQPGTYQLRLGVMDRLSRRIGTLDVPVTVDQTVAEKAPTHQ